MPLEFRKVFDVRELEFYAAMMRCWLYDDRFSLFHRAPDSDGRTQGCCMCCSSITSISTN